MQNHHAPSRGSLRVPVALSLLLCACGGGGGGSGSGGSQADLGDLVWQDLNGNGLQEPGEPGIAGVPVTVVYPSGGSKTTTTDANGAFSFKGLKSANYTLQVPTPLGLVPTLEGIGTDPAKDSARSPASFAAGSSDADFGFAGTASIGDRVWFDEDCDGLQDPGEAGLDGVRVVLSDGRGVERVTHTVDGYYLFTGLSADTYRVRVDDAPFASVFSSTQCNVGTDPELDSECNPATVVLANSEVRDTGTDFGYCGRGTSAIGDLIWHDLDLDGLQDAGEPGIPGVLVMLEDPAGNVLMQTKSNSQGRYEFGGLPAGDYVVVAMTPVCFAPTLCDVGNDDALDSECSPVAVSLAGGVDATGVDFGFVPIGTGAIGDFVWHDLDRDGLQDAGEAGIDKAKVALYDAQGALIDVQWTGPGGAYLFDGLCAGKYKVVVDVTASGVGFQASPCNVGNDDQVDNDCSPAWVTLATPRTVDSTVDFGYHVPEPHNGCSHGYWKNHTASWPWGYSANTLFSEVFEDAFPGMTLHAVLKQGGGGINALGREAVAALLNAASSGVSYPLLAQEVVDRFNAVHPGTKQEYNALKDEFEDSNTLGCPLN